jgi:hypothetical protein
MEKNNQNNVDNSNNNIDSSILDQARRLPQLFGLRLRVYLRFENG